jgi:two-component system LytT family response regulator
MALALKYLIVDDEELSRLSVESAASKFSFLTKIASCNNAVEASELIGRFHPDVVFADIEMPGITGLELIKSLPGQVVAPVFITSHPEFAVDSYDMDAFDYLLKPLNHERFERCALRLRDFFELRANAFAFQKDLESGFITIKQGHDKYKIALNDILYLEAMKDYIVLETLTGMHGQLPAGTFVRIHRSYIINRDRINAITGNKIHVNGVELPVGKLYKTALHSVL